MNFLMSSNAGFHKYFGYKEFIRKNGLFCETRELKVAPSITRSSWLNCALRDDEAVYWVSIGHYEAVAVGN